MDVPQVVEWMIEDNRMFFQDSEKALVFPLNEFIHESHVMKGVPPERLEWVTCGQNIYGLPHDVQPCMLVYNDTLWKAAGVDLDAIKTWDEFFVAAKKLTREKGKDGKPLHFALPSTNDGLHDTMFMVWQQSGAFTVWDWGEFANLLRDGTLCSYISPDWWIPQINTAAKKYRFRVRTLPFYKEGGWVTASWGGTFLAVPRSRYNEAHLARLYKLIEYMQYNKKKLIKRWKETLMLPPHREVWLDESFHEEDERFGGQKLGEVMIECANGLPRIRGGDLFWDAITDFTPEYQRMEKSELSIEEGLRRVQEKVLKRVP